MKSKARFTTYVLLSGFELSEHSSEYHYLIMFVIIALLATYQQIGKEKEKQKAEKYKTQMELPFRQHNLLHYLQIRLYLDLVISLFSQSDKNKKSSSKTDFLTIESRKHKNKSTIAKHACFAYGFFFVLSFID